MLRVTKCYSVEVSAPIHPDSLPEEFDSSVRIEHANDNPLFVVADSAEEVCQMLKAPGLTITRMELVGIGVSTK